jgi:hypothetical protein
MTKKAYLKTELELTDDQVDDLKRAWDAMTSKQPRIEPLQFEWWEIVAIGVFWFILGLVCGLTIAYPAHAADVTTLCRSTKPPDREWWSWREIEGRRCWYRGARNKPKAELRWSGAVLPPEPIPVTERPGVTSPDPSPGSFLEPFRSSYNVREWLNPTPIKGWQIWERKRP